MPKETFISKNSPVDTPGNDWRLQVCWGRDRFIELASFEADPLDALAGANQVWIELDRGGINRLIRTLRKARDQAYGSDA